MNQLAKEQTVYATAFQSQRFDAGDKLGYLKANIEVGLMHPELKTDLKNYLITLSQQLQGGINEF